MRKSKVLHVGKFFYPVSGGIENHLYNLSSELKTQVLLKILVANTRMKTETETVDGVKVVRVARLAEIKQTSICPSMPLWLNKVSADIIHVHTPNPMAVLAYMLGTPRGKLVVTYHGDILRQKIILKVYKHLLIAFLKRAERIIVTSDNYLESSWLLPRFSSKCTVIPLGLDVDRFQSLSSDDQRKIDVIKETYGPGLVLFVGRMTVQKGLIYLLKAADALNGKLLLIGDGPLRKELQEYVKTRGLDGKVIFFGNMDNMEVKNYYHACDAFALPSIQESFGMTLLEAMACGKPLVTTDLPTGVSYINQDGTTGFTVPSQSPRALARAVNALLQDRKMRVQMGMKGRERVKALFSKKIMAAKTLELYREIL